MAYSPTDMTGITERNGKYRVTVYHKSLQKGRDTETLLTHQDAVKWRDETKARLTLGSFEATKHLSEIYVDSLLLRYYLENTRTKKATTRDREYSKIVVLRSVFTDIAREHFRREARPTGKAVVPAGQFYNKTVKGGVTLDLVSRRFVANYIKIRMWDHGVCWDTVDKELSVLKSVIVECCDEWGIVGVSADVIAGGKKHYDKKLARCQSTGEERLREAKERDRRPTADEIDLIKTCNFKHATSARLAMATAMRCGELSRLVAADCDFSRNVIIIRQDKTNGNKGRTIPMTRESRRLLAELVMSAGKGVKLLGAETPQAISKGWAKVAVKLGIDNLRFHDFRHEATSALFEKGLATAEVAAVTGHRDWKSLKRYTQIRAEFLASKLLNGVDLTSANALREIEDLAAAQA